MQPCSGTESNGGKLAEEVCMITLDFSCRHTLSYCYVALVFVFQCVIARLLKVFLFLSDQMAVSCYVPRMTDRN